MIYRNVGAGLVGANLPDTTGFMEKALPDVQKMKAAAWGLPELEDITPPELEYEKNLDISATNSLNDYYKRGQDLMNTALKLRNVGIDVTKPSPFVENSVEAAQLWNQDYADWKKLGVELQQSLANQKMIAEQGKRPDVLTIAPPPGELVTRGQDWLLQLDENTVQAAADKFKNNYILYGKQNLDAAAEDYLKTGQVITDWYDNLIAQSDPRFANQLEQRKRTTLARMKMPYPDLQFDQKLKQAQDRLNLGWYNAETQRQFVPKEKVQAGVLESFKDIISGKGSADKFLMYSTGQPIKRNGKIVTDDSGNPLFYRAGRFLGVDKNNNKVSFQAIDENGNIAGKFQIPYLNSDGSLFFERSKFRDVLETQQKSQGTAFGYGQQPELPIATQYEGEPSGEVIVQTKKSSGKESEQSKTFTIINPQTGEILGTVKTQEEANKAIDKGYKVK